MYKIIVAIRKKADMARKDFLNYWQCDHPAYVRELPGIQRYRQNPAIEHRKKWPFDGVAEMWFHSLKDISIAFNTPEADALFKHEEIFIETMEWFITEESETDVALRDEGHAGGV